MFTFVCIGGYTLELKSKKQSFFDKLWVNSIVGEFIIHHNTVEPSVALIIIKRTLIYAYIVEFAEFSEFIDSPNKKAFQ